MKDNLASVLLSAVFLALTSTAMATTTLYVNGVSGSDSHNCLSATTACKTIGHAISLASPGDTIMVAAAIYSENLTIGKSLVILGSGVATTIIDGRYVNRVVFVSSSSAHVTLSMLTCRHGTAPAGGGIYNYGTLTINNSSISSNIASNLRFPAFGGGIYNSGTLTINDSTIMGNNANGGAVLRHGVSGKGGGIYNASGATGVALTINRSTITGNNANGSYAPGLGGGINNEGGMLMINNSTVSSNNASGYQSEGEGGGIYNTAPLTISNSTFSENSATVGGAVLNSSGSTVAVKNSIVANSPSGGNCSGTISSHGYNLSSDSTCNFTNTGDLNDTNPMLGPLQSNGGPTQTMALPTGSRAIDAGNPSGCTDGQSHLLKTDQRGMPRPDTGDTGGCDIGAYETPGCIPQGGLCYGPGPNLCCRAPFPHHSFCSDPTGYGTCIEN